MAVTIRLAVKLYEHINFGGQYRWLIDDVRDFGKEGFHDTVSSLIVYRGPSYAEGDIVRLYEHSNFGGGYLSLGPGRYSNIHIHPFNFGDKMSSADFLPAGSDPFVGIVRLVVTLYEHKNYGGQWRRFLFSESNLGNVGFHDKASSLTVTDGPDYDPGYVVNFYEHSNYGGGKLQPGDFGPGTNIPDLNATPYLFGDRISSLEITRL